MPFPVGVQTVTVTAGTTGYRTLDGSPYVGTVKFTPSVSRVVSAEHGVIALGPVNATIGASGQFTDDPELLAIDADGFLPSGWTYRVDEEFTNAPGRAYSVSLLAAVPEVALTDLVEVEASDGTTVWMSSTAGGDLSGRYPNPTVARINGVAVTGTPAAGQVPTATSSTTATWQAPAGGGGSGTPSDTVVPETGYGQSATAGAASTFARGDHTHGSPAAPTVGTTAGTYAAGNDSRIAGAAQKGQNLADLADPAAARTSLGLGTAAVQNAGAFDASGAATGAVSTHSLAADPHGDRGYADTQVNTRVPTSRQILAGTGLAGGGTLAADRTLNVSYGTGAGTAAVGNDARLSDARTPTGAAGGDLSGTYPDPAVAKVNGITLSGTPSTGKVLTATSATTADWQTPSGGGSSIVSTDGRIDAQIIVLVPVAGWAIVATSGGVEIGKSVPASVGDHLWYSPSFLRTYGVFLDMGIKAAAGGISRYTSSGNATPEPDGYAPLYPEPAFAGVAGMREFIVQEGEVDGSGNATIVLAYRGNSVDGINQKVYFGGGPGYSGAMFVANAGQ